LQKALGTAFRDNIILNQSWKEAVISGVAAELDTAAQM